VTRLVKKSSVETLKSDWCVHTSPQLDCCLNHQSISHLYWLISLGYTLLSSNLMSAVGLLPDSSIHFTSLLADFLHFLRIYFAILPPCVRSWTLPESSIHFTSLLTDFFRIYFAILPSRVRSWTLPESSIHFTYLYLLISLVYTVFSRR
jgi:hypothetical protein